MSSYSQQTYLSPFTWRYGSEKMRKIFSERHKVELWRKIWVALATAQNKAGLVTKAELNDLKRNQDNIDMEEILEIEKEVRHDLVSAIREYAGKAKIGGGKIHLGATSMDVVDNADAIKVKEAMDLIDEKLLILIRIFAKKAQEYAHLPCLGYTHLQPAEPTTVGYRLAFYTQDLLIAREAIAFAKRVYKGKGMKGAVGTAASYESLLEGKSMRPKQLEDTVMRELGIDSALITTQVYPRLFDYSVLNGLATIASALAKFAGDLRILQSPHYGEWSEPFGKKQVGSSAMPFKKNPISAENICSLARYVITLPQVAAENASLSYLERTLDDSANKRIIVPEAFLAVDQMIESAEKIIRDIVINKERIKYNLDQYAAFTATESIIIEAVKKGANRQEMHERLREISMIAWGAIQKGDTNPIEKLLLADKKISTYINAKKLKTLLDVKNHIGDAPERTMLIIKKIK